MAATPNPNDKLARLQDCRKKAEDVSTKRSRLSGEIDSHKTRAGELEQRCKTDYGCDIKDLPTLIADLDKEATRSIEEAERILATPAGKATAPVPAVPQAAKPIARQTQPVDSDPADVL